MRLYECLENEAFNELINFSFEEVRSVFNQNKYFVSVDQGNQFIREALQSKEWYIKELEKIETYTQGEYTDLVNLGVDIPEYDQPQFMVKDVELQMKSRFISMIKKYFNKNLFEQNRSVICSQEIFKEESIEKPHELWV